MKEAMRLQLHYSLVKSVDAPGEECYKGNDTRSTIENHIQKNTPGGL